MGQITEDKRDTLNEPLIEEITVAPPAEGPTSTVGPPAQSTTQQGITVYDGMLLALVTVWAANPAAIKWALQYMDPLTFNALRFTLATLVPVTLLLIGKESFKWHKGDGWKIFLLGLVGHGLYQVIFIMAIDQTLAGNVALILSVNPAFIAVFAALLGYEQVRAFTWIGVCFSLAGVGLVILGSGEKFDFGPRLIGDLMMVAVTMMWALYTVLSQRLLRRYSSVKLNALAMPVGVIILLIVGFPSIVNSAPSWGNVPALAWVFLALSGVLAVSLSYIAWYKGLQKLGSTRTAVYANLVPVLAAAISFVFLNEPLGWLFWAGMVLVIAGVTLARFGDRLLQNRTGKT